MKYKYTFSKNCMYRYLADCDLGVDGPTALFMGLSPINTNRGRMDRGVNYAVTHGGNQGWGRILVCNIYSVVSDHVKHMPQDRPHRGPEHWKWVDWALDQSEIVVACWGSRNRVKWGDRVVFNEMNEWFRGLDKDLYCTNILYTGDPALMQYHTKLKRVADLEERTWGVQYGLFQGPIGLRERQAAAKG